MTTNTFPNYTLHGECPSDHLVVNLMRPVYRTVLEARDVVWTGNLRKRPNMYVEITSAGLKTMRTRVVQESSTPTWNEIFPLYVRHLIHSEDCSNDLFQIGKTVVCSFSCSEAQEVPHGGSLLGQF